jgi:Fic family protein
MKEFTPKFTITNTMTEALTRIERARGFLEAATLSEDWITRMSQRAILLEAHYTTHIEGTQLTLEQAEELWDGGIVKNANPDDRQELLNYGSVQKKLVLNTRFCFVNPLSLTL